MSVMPLAALEDDTAQFDPLLGTLAQRRGLRAYLHGLLLPCDRNTTMTTSAGAEPVVGAQHAAVQGLQWSVRQRRMCLTRVSWLSALAVQSVAEAPPKSNVERDSLATGPAAATCQALPARGLSSPDPARA
jgi:hypothetical protein